MAQKWLRKERSLYFSLEIEFNNCLAELGLLLTILTTSLGV
jgi:hypothetical protein